MPTPEITVIIPCYNCALFIEDAIKSIIDQDYEDWELILIDDHSTDDTPKIASKYAMEYPKKIYYYSNPFKGASAARNFGLVKALGKYLQFLDADDLIMKNKLSTQLEVLKKQDIDVVFSDYVTIDFYTEKIIETIKFKNFETCGLFYLIRFILGSGNPLYNIDSVRNIGGYNEKLKSAQDWDFHIRLYASGARFKYLPGSFFIVRKTAGSVSSNWLSVYETACDYLPEIKDKIHLHKDYNDNIGDYLASVYYLTLVHGSIVNKREEYRKEMRYWAKHRRKFLGTSLKKILAFIIGLRLLESIDRIRAKKHI